MIGSIDITVYMSEGRINRPGDNATGVTYFVGDVVDPPPPPELRE